VASVMKPEMTVLAAQLVVAEVFVGQKTLA
jgi:hypothetical protein